MVVASALLAIVVGGAFAFVLVTITELRGTTDLRRQTREELVGADTLESRIIDLETGLRGFVITRDESFLEPSNEARAALPGSARALEHLAAGEPVQLARVRRIVAAMNEYLRQYALPLVDAVRRNDPSAHSVEATVAAKRRVDALREGLASFRDTERARLSTRDADVDQAARRATAAAAVGIAVSILLIVVFGGYLTRVIVRPLRRAAQMSDRLAGGDLSARMPETDVAEIGALERSFNVMAGSLQTSQEEQAALRRVATLVAEEASPADVFARVAEEVASVLGDVDCTLVRDEGDGMGSAIAHWTRNAASAFPPGAQLRLDGNGVIASVLREGRPYRIEDYSSTTGTLGERARRIGLRSAVGCPIVVGGRTWGAMSVATPAVEPFPPETEGRIAQFGELVATAIANDRARAEVERLAEEQAALRRVATLVAKGAAPTAVFEAVAAEMEQLLGADAVALSRYEAGAEVTVVAHRGPGARDGDDGENVSAPIIVDGRVWGLIAASWRGEDSPPPDTGERMARFAQLLDTAIANADSRDQLTASRARLVTEGDDARRRVVRDLHDGVQQRLVHTIITLKLARRARRQGDENADALLDEALEYAEESNAELRELAHGILPAVLTRGGLQAGVDAMVARLDLPVDMDVPDERFPAEIEASAYFVVAEALTNVVKHARATRAQVSVAVEDGMLHLAVRDDGTGDADPRGHGLVGMSDRVAALGGRLEIDSPAGGGTLVTAELPLSAT